MLQKAIHEKSPIRSWGMHAVARFFSKGRKFSRLETQEPTYCAERYGIPDFWQFVVTMAGYPEDVTNILDLDEQTARPKIPGEWLDLGEQEEWQDLVWSGRCLHDQDEITKDEVKKKHETNIEKRRRSFRTMKKVTKLKQIKGISWYICIGCSDQYHVTLKWRKGNRLFIIY